MLPQVLCVKKGGFFSKSKPPYQLQTRQWVSDGSIIVSEPGHYDQHEHNFSVVWAAGSAHDKYDYYYFKINKYIILDF